MHILQFTYEEYNYYELELREEIVMRKLCSKILFRKRWTCLIAVILIVAVGGIIYKVRKPANNNAKAVTQQSQDSKSVKQNNDSNNSNTKDQQSVQQSGDGKVVEQTSNSNNPNTESQQVKQANQSNTQKSKDNSSEKFSKNIISDNTKIYYVPGHKVYHLNRNDATIKDNKDVKTMTLKEAKEKGMKSYDTHS